MLGSEHRVATNSNSPHSTVQPTSLSSPNLAPQTSFALKINPTRHFLLGATGAALITSRPTGIRIVTNQQRRRAVRLRLAVPFGRYLGQSESEPGTQQTLVGREGQRAYFLDLLHNHGPHGAYLVTGQRGAGKSSFVRQALRNFEDDVYSRALRSGVGRPLFWDRLLLWAILLVVIILFLISHEVLNILVELEELRSLPRQDRLRSLMWFAILPFAFICASPIVFAIRVLEARIDTRHGDPDRRERRSGSLPAFLATSLVVIITFLLSWPADSGGPPFLEAVRSPPHVLISRLFVGIATWATLMTLVDGRPKSELDPAAPVAPTNTGPLGFLAGLAALVVPFVDLVVEYLNEERLSDDAVYWFNLTLGLAIAALYLFSSTRHRRNAASLSPLRLNWHQLGAIILGPFTLICGLATHAEVLQASSSADFESVPLVGGTVLAILILLLARTARRGSKSHEDSPHPGAALTSKAIAVAMLGAHLTLPLGIVAWAETDESTKATLVDIHPTLWPLAVVCVMSFIIVLEYEWIVRPFAWLREDLSRDLSRKHFVPHDKFVEQQSRHRKIIRYTFYSMIYRHWRRMLVIRVNLGFETLSHTHVVHAMLAGLRESYHRAFVSVNSPIAIGGFLIKALLVLAMSTLIGDALFSGSSVPPPNEDSRPLTVFIDELASALPKPPPTSAVERRNTTTSPDSFLPLLVAPDLVQTLYHPFIGGTPHKSHQLSRDELMLCEFLSCRGRSFGVRVDERGEVVHAPGVPGVTVRVYHLVTFLVLWIILAVVTRMFGRPPYRKTLHEIDNILDQLAGKTGIVLRGSMFNLGTWPGSLVTAQEVTSRERERADPRVLEVAILHVFSELQAPRLPFAQGLRVNLPAPEVTFVFDELDKLGTRTQPSDQQSTAGEEWLVQSAERARSSKVHDLFADMKNLLSAAPARFIMVGGRNLHDEWLADQTKRMPLLTNIFHGSIYLPSLLIDHPGHSEANWSWTSRIHQFVETQKRRAEEMLFNWRNDSKRPTFGLARRPKLSADFAQPHSTANKCTLAFELLDGGVLVDGQKWSGTGISTIWNQEFSRELIDFLAFRSKGNPKKLKELFESFLRPTGRYVKNKDSRWKGAFAASDHILLFDEDERFRIQLVSVVYRELESRFQRRFLQRDDKLVTALFYFSDFLFKFHQRAFSWSNLERVDELVHIHRAPDHRKLFEDLVDLWSSKMLHPILNGLYAVRFRSDMAREIAYISRRSNEEMAAFNFTLDESQALKESYSLNVKGAGDKATHDVIAGLGELHEFDQEYEIARHYYEQARRRLDRGLAEETGVEDCVSEVLRSTNKGLRIARNHITWGVLRLRLGLQLGMTYEVTRNFERATVEYRDAKTLSQVLLRAYLDDFGRAAGKKRKLPVGHISNRDHRRLHVLNHLNILFQANFAEAWLSEKIEGAVDTSVNLIERSLYGMRRTLPFAREVELPLQEREGPIRILHGNFSLIMAEMHNKAGDLYFFKGRQLATPAKLAETANMGKERGGAEGYLLRAHYHYALGLHDVRRFVSDRMESSRHKLNIWTAKETNEPTMEPSGWSGFMSRVAGGGLADLAEAGLGRVSLFGLLHCLHDKGRNSSVVESHIGEIVDGVLESVTRWFESTHGSGGAESFSAVCKKLDKIMPGMNPGTLSGWFGKLTPKDWDASGKWLQFAEPHDDLQRLIMSILLSFAGADKLREAGYYEDAGRELIQIADTVSHYLWWANGLRSMIERGERLTKQRRAAARYLEKLEKKVKEAEKAGKSDIAQTREELQDARDQLTKLSITLTLEEAVSLKTSGPGAWRNLAVALDMRKGKPFWDFMLDCGLEALKRACDYLKHRQHSSSRRPADYLPVEMLYLCCSLGLGADFSRWNFQRRGQMLVILEALGGKGLAPDKWKNEALHSKITCKSTWVKFMRTLIKRGLARHSFPVLARLRGIKLYIDFLVLESTPEEQVTDHWKQDLRQWVEELIWLEDQVQAPLHFTPFHSGVTLAQSHIALRDSAWHASALRHIEASLEVISMRRTFYESISNLYYLYDDFNDRQIHFNHALQMAGWEYATLLRDCLVALEK
ncbi:MAG: hypothetical protein R6X02_01060 [Enhygromyxa sp.]